MTRSYTPKPAVKISRPHLSLIPRLIACSHADPERANWHSGLFMPEARMTLVEYERHTCRPCPMHASLLLVSVLTTADIYDSGVEECIGYSERYADHFLLRTELPTSCGAWTTAEGTAGEQCLTCAYFAPMTTSGRPEKN